MGREIKFRVWDKINRRFSSKPHFLDLEGFVVSDIDPYGLDMSGKRTIKSNSNYAFAGLFTGLKDKNRKDAYFGDVIKYKDESGTPQIGVIKDYGYASGYFEAINGDDEGNQDLELHPDHEFEIIGNIYQNPELLELT